MKTIDQYCKLKINGMNYVRIIKTEEGNEIILIIDSKNKPIVRVCKYLHYLKNENGYANNTIKRIAYDLVTFFDYMQFNNLDEELIERKHLINFLCVYLKILDPNIKSNDCIDKSMLNEIPILNEYKNKKIIILEDSNTGYSNDTMIRIIGTVKEYLVYLQEKTFINIRLNELFSTKVRLEQRDIMISNPRTRTKIYYSAESIIKSARINQKCNEIIKPIDVEKIFETNEEEAFISSCSNNRKHLVYKLLFELMGLTGLRINEALGLKFVYEKGNLKYQFDINKIQGDIECNNNIWTVKVVPRIDSPLDINVKFNKYREVCFSDQSMKIKNLLEIYLSQRAFIMKRKNVKEHGYLFVNNQGNRLRYGATEKMFNKKLIESKLEHRKGDLTIHSFRHTYASKWFKNAIETKKDIELDLLAEMLGHSNSNTTRKTYCHLFEKDRQALLEKLEDSKYYGVDKNETIS